MLKFIHNRLRFSFNELWLPSMARNPDFRPGNADDLLYTVCSAQNFATGKRFPYFRFPKTWNEEPIIKLNPSKTTGSSSVKSALLE